MTMIEQKIQACRDASQDPVCAYLYDLSALRHHVERLVSSLPECCRLFYAIKANSAAPILETLSEHVHGFEVASLGEIQKVRAVSPTLPILFGGPGKTDQELDGAIRNGVRLIHVESRHELLRLDRLAAEARVTVPVLLRVNLKGLLPAAKLQMAGTPTQFGIDQTELPEVLAAAAGCRHLEVRGFHFHSVSNNLDAEAHARLVLHYIEQARGWAEQFDLQLAYINAGGGIGVNYAELDQQFDWDRFATLLRDVVSPQLPSGCQLLFECGRFLTASCGYYAVEVLDIKRNHGDWFAVVRGGTHHFRLPVSWQHSHPFVVLPIEEWRYPFPRPEIRNASVTVVGQLCTPKDVLARSVPVPQLRAGDIIVFQYAGAYGWDISHHDFLSHPHPDRIFIGTRN